MPPQCQFQSAFLRTVIVRGQLVITLYQAAILFKETYVRLAQLSTDNGCLKCTGHLCDKPKPKRMEVTFYFYESINIAVMKIINIRV